MSKRNLSIVTIIGIVAIVLIAGIFPALAIDSPVDSLSQVALVETAPDTEFSPVEIYREVSPSVVAINVFKNVSSGMRFSQPDINPQQPPSVPAVSGGSGFVFDTEGHIVTNYHVVEGATRIEVNFFDGTKATAEIIGLDPDSDLAVIKVDLPDYDYKPVRFADSSQLEVGESVLAIGSPFGERWTLTTGIVSGLDRTIAGLSEMGFSIGGVIQTDAAINPGNSGGPLLNARGEVVGVNSQIVSRSGGNDGVGFAVPSNLTERIAAELIERGFVEYSYLGIRGGDVTLSVIEALGLPNDMQGVMISEATSGGPAARAGLQSAGDFTDVNGLEIPQQVDIITGINDEEITGINDLIGYLARETRPGDEVTLKVLRNGTEELELPTRLMPRP